MTREERRERNRTIFMETEDYIRKSPKLLEATEESLKRSKIYYEKDEVKAGDDISEGAKIVLSNDKTINAALKYRGEKVCIHNFASATNPGGGVLGGSSAQEESICRATNLYNVISDYSLNEYYEIHRPWRDEGYLFTSAFIYTPDVVIFREDDDYFPFLDESMNCDVVTMAAPHLNRERIVSKERLTKIFLERFDRLFAAASSNGCTVLISGAFGCGAFHNNPEIVSKAFKEIAEKYKKKFKVIEAAVYYFGDEDKNYKAFERALF